MLHVWQRVEKSKHSFKYAVNWSLFSYFCLTIDVREFHTEHLSELQQTLFNHVHSGFISISHTHFYPGWQLLFVIHSRYYLHLTTEYCDWQSTIIKCHQCTSHKWNSTCYSKHFSDILKVKAAPLQPHSVPIRLSAKRKRNDYGLCLWITESNKIIKKLPNFSMAVGTCLSA